MNFAGLFMGEHGSIRTERQREVLLIVLSEQKQIL